MDATLGAVIETAFPGRAVDRVNELPESGHPGNHTVCLHFADGDQCFLKLRRDSDRERNEREAAVLQYARTHCEVRVPSVIAADSAWTPPYLVTDPLEGTPALQDWTAEGQTHRAAIARDIGRAVAGITAARFDDHGWITGGSSSQLVYEAGPWNTVLADAIERDATVIDYPPRFADTPGRVAALLRESGDILNDAPAALVHQDVHLDNIFRNDQLGVIDWEWTLIGDPGLGLCWAEEWVAERADVSASDRAQLLSAVRTGYRAQSGALPTGLDQRRPVYRVVTFLPTVRTFDRWAPDASEPTAGLADWVETEFAARMTAAKDATVGP